MTPDISRFAGPDNYCYWNGDPRHEPPEDAGKVYRDKAEFAQRIIDDHPNGLPGPIIGGQEYFHGEGCVIGGPGFGWVMLDKLERFWNRFPDIGGVWFGASVELGSNITIDRGSIRDTTIGPGVKIDNGVHVGHNAFIGANTRIAAHAIIGGSAVIGTKCWIGLGAIIKEQLVIGDGATIGMGAIVLKDVRAGETWVGNPARKLR